MPKTLTAAERNEQIYQLLVDLLKNANNEPSFKEPFDEDNVEAIFNTSIWGHREIVLTIIMARLINPKFRASVDFYACNPRSIFEKPIRKALREFGIPHRKSGPLNVAKNIKKINKDWATDKNGGDIAIRVVNIVNGIEKVSGSELMDFAQAFVSRYKQEAQRIKDMEVDLPPQESPLFLFSLCSDLIDNVPDRGATAQMLIGLLMETVKASRNSQVEVSGYMDSVSTTNTTSKKPGDVMEKLTNGVELVYEITTKEFTDDRLLESHESVIDYDKEIQDVFVICRPQDVPKSLEINQSYIMASTQYRELSYYFVDIYYYIQSALLFLTPDARKSFYESLIAYVNKVDTSEKVKIYLKVWHQDHQS